jgi:lysophospholipase L1-like esterase
MAFDISRRTRTSTPLAFIILLFWGAAAEAQLTIMPLGDSITYGDTFNGPVPGGYRTHLYSDLHNAGYSFTFVGTQTANPSPLLTQAGQTHHEGHNGFTIDNIANNLDGNDGSQGNSGGFWFHKPGPPDVVLLLTGGPDIAGNFQTSTLSQRLDKLIGQIASDSPTSLLLVSSLTPAKSFNANQNQLVLATNTQLKDVIVPKYESMGNYVIFVDQYSNFVDASGNIIHIGADGIHPDQIGYDLIGDTWAAALRTVLPAPVLVTGYSADVISDKDASARFAQPFAAGTFAWFESGAVDDGGAQHNDGLQAGVSFVSATGSRATYQLQPANVNNVLQLSAGQTGTLTLMTPTAYSTLYVLASSGDGTPTSMGSGNINFADGSTQAFSYNAFDWCNGPYGQGGMHPEAVLKGPIGRADVGPSGTAFTYNQDCDFQVYETVIAIDASHAGVAIASIDFTAAPDAYYSNIFAVGGR